MIAVFNKNNFQQYLECKINITCKESTKSYIIGNLANIKRNDLSKDSITLFYGKAVQNYNFEKFQNLADHLFFIECFFPENLKNASAKYYNDIAKKSYYSCYKIVNKRWILFEELADQFEVYTRTIKENFSTF